MSVGMEDGVKRWTAKRKTALVIEINGGGGEPVVRSVAL